MTIEKTNNGYISLMHSETFKSWVGLLKSEIRRTQIKASVKVNSELLHLYWHLG